MLAQHGAREMPSRREVARFVAAMAAGAGELGGKQSAQCGSSQPPGVFLGEGIVATEAAEDQRPEQDVDDVVDRDVRVGVATIDTALP